MSASIALQILPNVSDDAEVCRIVDAAIEPLMASGLNCHVGPFETTVEGADIDSLLDLVRQSIHAAAGAGAPKVSVYLKAVWKPEGDILTIDQKIGKYHK